METFLAWDGRDQLSQLIFDGVANSTVCFALSLDGVTELRLKPETNKKT